MIPGLIFSSLNCLHCPGCVMIAVRMIPELFFSLDIPANP